MHGMEVGDTTESGAPALFEKLPVFLPIAERRSNFLPFYKQLIALGKAHPALQEGETEWVRNGAPERVLTEGNLAASLVEMGQMDEALEHIHSALELDPDFADAHNMLGIVLARAGKLDESIAQLRQVVSLVPDSPEYHFNLSRFLAAEHHFPEAIPECDKAVELWGGNEPQSLSMHAGMCSEVGRFSDAAQTARRALALASAQNDVSLSQTLRARIAYYESQVGAVRSQP